jgi:hypothetical protein
MDAKDIKNGIVNDLAEMAVNLADREKELYERIKKAHRLFYKETDPLLAYRVFQLMYIMYMIKDGNSLAGIASDFIQGLAVFPTGSFEKILNQITEELNEEKE